MREFGLGLGLIHSQLESHSSEDARNPIIGVNFPELRNLVGRNDPVSIASHVRRCEFNRTVLLTMVDPETDI